LVGADGAKWVQRDLYGGAITISLPKRFVDISTFRQVPDNQEVFSDVDTEQSVIIDLLEMERKAPNDAACNFHFDSIAHDNEAVEHSIEQTFASEDLNPHYNGTRSTCFGIQKVAKFNELEKLGEEACNLTRIYVAVFRLTDVATDLVVSFNSPVEISTLSSSAKTADVDAVEEKADPLLANEDFTKMVDSLKVVDFGLFNTDDEETK